MKKEKNVSLNKNAVEILRTALLYLHMAELRSLCTALSLNAKGVKNILIQHILTYVGDSEKQKTITNDQTIPVSSKARKGAQYPLLPTTLMVYGSYKNDLKSREFFKKLIGPHFHFTVFGLDWLKKRWLHGNPPTYAEFALFWQQEYQARKGKPGELKKEWAYMNFLREYGSTHPSASKQEAINAWKLYRQKQVQLVHNLLHSVTQKN